MENQNTSHNLTCLNCGSVVEKNYCPECGQSLKERKRSFYYLFYEALSSFTNYDGVFWITVRYLLFYPGKLSIEFVKGRYVSYVNPVKLYLFISFLAFLIPSFIDYESDNKTEKEKTVINKDEVQKAATQTVAVSVNNSLLVDNDLYEDGQALSFLESTKHCKTVAELDSMQNNASKEERLSWIEYTIAKAAIVLGKQDGSSNFSSLFKDHFPNFLFFYMPFFAFWLWVFSRKKDFYLFDCTVFSLHLFSAILLSITIYNILDWLMHYFSITWIDGGLITTIMFFYFNYYFFKAFGVFFQKGWSTSIIKGGAILTINIIFFFIMFLLFLALLLFLVLNSAH